MSNDLRIRGGVDMSPLWREKHIEDLRRIFPKTPITPTTPVNAVYFNAGIDTVLEYIKGKVSV